MGKYIYFLVGHNNSLKKHFMLLKFLHKINLFSTKENKYIDIIKGIGSKISFKNEGNFIINKKVRDIVAINKVSQSEEEFKKLQNIFETFSKISIIDFKMHDELHSLWKLYPSYMKNVNLYTHYKKVGDKYFNSFNSVLTYDSKNKFFDLKKYSINKILVKPIEDWNKYMHESSLDKILDLINIEKGTIENIKNSDIDNLMSPHETKQYLKKHLEIVHKTKSRLSIRDLSIGLTWLILQTDSKLRNEKIKNITQQKNMSVKQDKFFSKMLL
jgi:hypothetical protein